ncbi:PREDICTED: uncharacterized protein LOC109150346 [Ipomoea nil]|uniref:uncharacterized protein LOC109150346 n=1 Tax=Ipomoea nil TaxID=35883 RepID=UPI000901DE7E|nr:PREDICTED: uncharacterized protein LOC109150346 [Ipomoea nil]
MKIQIDLKIPQIRSSSSLLRRLSATATASGRLLAANRAPPRRQQQERRPSAAAPPPTHFASPPATLTRRRPGTGSLLYRVSNSEGEDVQSLDWITRLKIAIGTAEALSYLNHECYPPLIHRNMV